MRVIKGLALGTYYAPRSTGGNSTPHASPMRGLLYAVKDNRTPPNARQPIAHPRHPSSAPVRVDRTNAIEYVAAIVTRYRAKIAAFFDAADAPITLVPVPSSDVTLDTIETARFPTLRLCRALAGAGLGDVRILAAQAGRLPPKHEGNDYTAVELRGNLRRTSTAAPRSGVIVYVEDNVHRGRSIIALDQLVGGPARVAVFTVALTDSAPRSDAYTPRKFSISYDPDDDALVGGVER